MDYVVLCLDSVRYDTFVAAKPKNMLAVGDLQEAWAQGQWTLPSVTGMLWNYPHMGLNKKSFIDKYGLRVWLPSTFKRDKYKTVLLNGNAVIHNFDMTVPECNLFHSTFEYNSVTNERQTIKRFNDASKALSTKDPVFLFILEMATHNPYFDGKKTHKLNPATPAYNFINQVNSIKYVDSIFPIIMNSIKKETKLIITSDHGDLFGPDAWDHTPAAPTRFDENLYRVPYIETIVKV